MYVLYIFSKVVLDITDGIHDIGTLKWELVLCLLLAWVLVCFCLARGIKSGGKVTAVWLTILIAETSLQFTMMFDTLTICT